ncbi:MAG: 2-amino-4-hydroxy-6-hydroxymethyldihydropteridine diphosphokinase [Candidatus Lightella neohaematopini]|nr:2-amino-4-hydroxy-6-hydroxymethyldihydropteridine diphosphokinase [Candidatus Lightella neohaematopini]
MIKILNQINFVWLSLGSNLNYPINQINNAIDKLRYIPYTKVIRYSSYYESIPLNNYNQPNYVNSVVILNTMLSLDSLFNFIKIIEYSQGRRYNCLRWSSRIIDLDILLFGNYVINTSKLTVPHYDMLNREFVIYPMIELDSSIKLPNGLVIKDSIKFLSNKRVLLLKKCNN